MTEDTRRFKSTSEMALSRIGGTVPSALPGDHLGAQGQVIRGVVSGDQAAQIQRNIDRTMLGLVADIRRGGDPVWVARDRQRYVRPTQHRSTLVAPAGERRCQSRPPAARLHKHTLTLLHTVSNHMAFPIQNGKGRSDVCRAVAERTSRC
jgi:hypothetical protein